MNQIDFIALDTVSPVPRTLIVAEICQLLCRMILIAVIVMVLFSPGYCFGYKNLLQIPAAPGDVELTKWQRA